MRKLWCKFISNNRGYSNVKFVPIVDCHHFVSELTPFVLVNNRILAIDNTIVIEEYGLLSEIIVEESLISSYLKDVETVLRWREDYNITVLVVGTSLPYVVAKHSLIDCEQRTFTLYSFEEVKEKVKQYIGDKNV